MTDELLHKASHIRDRIDSLKHSLEHIGYWDGNFRRMADDYYYIPDEMKEEVTRYVAETLKERYTKEMEELEKEFADL